MNEKEKCEHINWTVCSDDRLGDGTCLDCHKQVCLSILFNNLRERMEATIKKMSIVRND